MCDTSNRRHPRTLNEAFPGSPEYASSIEIYEADCRLCSVLAIVAAIFAVIIFTIAMLR